MLKRLLLLGLGLGLVVFVAGCEESRRSGQAQPPSRSKAARREVSYQDKTPEQWIRYLRSYDVRRRNRAIDALLQYGPAQIPAIIEVIEDKSLDGARLSAAQALGAFGAEAEAAVPALVAALKDRKWNGRDGAAMALGRIARRPEEVVPALLEALQSDSDETVRAASAEALGKMGDASSAVVSALASALDDKAANVRAEAAEALQRLGPKAQAALPALEKAAESQEFIVKQAATEAVKAIRGRP